MSMVNVVSKEWSFKLRSHYEACTFSTMPSCGVERSKKERKQEAKTVITTSKRFSLNLPLDLWL